MRLAPNQANSQWNLSNGTISLISNPSLCMTGPTNPTAQPYAVTVELCTPGNPAQQFTYQGDSQYPFMSVFQGTYALGSNGGGEFPGTQMYLYPSTVGTGIQSCDSGNTAEQFTFTGSGSTAGLLKNSDGQCVYGYCTDLSNGCAPMPFVPCNQSDSNQLFTYSNEYFVNQNNGLCIDLWAGTVRMQFHHDPPAHNAYRGLRLECTRAMAQATSSGHSAARSCRMSVIPANALPLMRSRRRQIKSWSMSSAMASSRTSTAFLLRRFLLILRDRFYGPDVTDHCIAACPGN